MTESTGQSQRYCSNCGAEVRPGASFCVSCGVNLAPRMPGAAQQDQSTPTSPGGGTSPSIHQRVVQWFKDLPGTPKLILVALILLVVIVPISPVIAVLAAIMLGISIVALFIRVAQGNSLKRWGITALASLLLAFTFSGISGALYSIGSVENAEYDAVAPGLEDTAESWASSSMESALFVPGYLPYSVVDVEDSIAESGYGLIIYEITTSNGRIALTGDSGYGNASPFTMDDSEDSSCYYDASSPGIFGGYRVTFWCDGVSEATLEVDASFDETEIMRILASMVRVETQATS